MYDQFVGATVTCSWQCHVAHKIADLGEDTAAPVGTPILAPFAGTLRNIIRKESPVLYIAELSSDADPQLVAQYMHLSRFAPAGHYSEKQPIGWSGGKRGAAGSGQATGPHIHRNAIINGHLAPYEDLFTTLAEVGTQTPVTRPLEGIKMRLLPQDNTKTYFLEVEGRGLYTVPNQATADMIYRYLNDPAPLRRADIDGVAAFISGPPTYKTFWSPQSTGADPAAIASAVRAALVGEKFSGVIA